ncbi:MAG: hypothetical protein ACJ75B_12075 [Flavisolibacter sp.]
MVHPHRKPGSFFTGLLSSIDKMIIANVKTPMQILLPSSLLGLLLLSILYFRNKIVLLSLTAFVLMV